MGVTGSPSKFHMRSPSFCRLIKAESKTQHERHSWRRDGNLARLQKISRRSRFFPIRFCCRKMNCGSKNENMNLVLVKVFFSEAKTKKTFLCKNLRAEHARASEMRGSVVKRTSRSPLHGELDRLRTVQERLTKGSSDPPISGRARSSTNQTACIPLLLFLVWVTFFFRSCPATCVQSLRRRLREALPVACARGHRLLTPL